MAHPSRPAVWEAFESYMVFSPCRIYTLKKLLSAEADVVPSNSYYAQNALAQQSRQMELKMVFFET